MRSASFLEEVLWFLKEDFECFLSCDLEVASQKYIHTKHSRSLGKCCLFPWVGLIGTDSLVPRLSVGTHQEPGYEATMSHTQKFYSTSKIRSIASKMCERIIFDFWMNCHTYTLKPTCVVNAFQCIGQTILIYFPQGLCHLCPRGWPTAQVPLQPCVHHLNHALLWVGLKLAPNVIKYGGREVQGVSEVKPHGCDISQLYQQVVQVYQFIWRERRKID